MRKILSTITLSVLSLSCLAQVVKSFTTFPDRVDLAIPEGTLSIIPLSENSVRVRAFRDPYDTLQELIITSQIKDSEYKIVDSDNEIKIILPELIVSINKLNGSISYSNKEGKIFLNEKEDGRILRPETFKDDSSYFVEQSFKSDFDEYLFGLGQFQDGHYNIKNVSRRLTQVNSQIAIPFIYSSKGYGILWHQYGLTDFNPATNNINLKEIEPDSTQASRVAEVTTTAGTQRVAQNQSLYQGEFEITNDGEYSIFLDLADMGNRYFVSVDGTPIIDQSNMWLPPTAGMLIKLKAGKHTVQVICKSDNNPTLSWKKSDNFTTFRSPVAKALDYVVFWGPSADKVIQTYRNLTGNAPLFPKWAYGFWQCRERYTSSTHLVETVKEFRKRKLPLDVIVQDWQYWGNRGWGVPQFDQNNYPNPQGFIKELHDLNAHFNVSIWSNPDKNSEIGKIYVEKNRFITNTKWLDYFNPATREDYWNTLKVNMFDFGVDSWWMDAVEPENDALKGTTTHIGYGDFYRLVYPLMVSQAVYEGQRNSTSNKRVCILTRSAFSGQQRYGIINWSGDIGYTWDVYRNQIVAGLNFTITGFPYWTTDIGGFFRPGRSQYTDPEFHELLTRWYQWGTFNPIFRMHGYQTETEPWKYGPTVEENMRKMLNLRYRLLPYIYSEAWQVTSNGSTIMRPLVMDFINDIQAINSRYQFMFGKSILIAPVIKPGITEMDVYLPKSTIWFDFWTGEQFSGGKTVITNTPIDKLPLFVKAGSIIPMGSIIQFVDEKPTDTLEIRVYRGADGEFELYEDEGDNYNYESGKHSIITFKWNNKRESLTISDRIGDFKGSLKERVFNIVLVNKESGLGIDPDKSGKEIIYKGKKTTLKFKQ
ncbi:MAG TPA: TIM-barrel domain-containing protein [Bacteroidaceae bacterium]|nr:TIM-barrel domain-containing protein [Bacteroidaceae bacterium]